MNVLVTGAAGFIGFHLATRLLKDGHSVVGVDNLNTYYNVELKKDRLAMLEEHANFRYRFLDFAERGPTEDLFASEEFDIVVHLGAQAGVRYSLENPYAFGDSNLSGFLNILEGCRQRNVKHLVFASSSSVYGLRHDVPFSVDQNVDHPISLYAATKKANELMAHSYAHLYGLPVTGLRFFTVYGPWGRPDMAYFSFTSAISKGEQISVFNNGEMERDMTFIDDAVEGIVRLLDKAPDRPDIESTGASDAPYRIYNVGGGRPVKLGRFIEAIEAALGLNAIKKYLPMQPGDVRITYADVQDLEEATGFTPQITVEEGIDRFVRWYLEYSEKTGVEMTYLNRLPFFLALALILVSTNLYAQKDNDDEEAEEKDEFAELIEDAVLREGFFDTYEKDNHLYFVIPEDRLGEDFLLTSQIARGFGSGLLNGGLMLSFALGTQVVAFEKHSGKVFLVQRPVAFTADDQSPAALAVDMSFGSSVLQSAKIETSPGDSSVVIDTYGWFVSDFSNIGSFVRNAVSTTPGKPGRATFDSDRSFMESVESFDDNLNVIAKLTFKPGEPVSLRGVPDSRYIPLSIHYGLVKLPETPMEPRLADDRVGYFMTVRKNFSDDDRTFFDRFIQKWRLECANEPDADGLCDPVKPITYYVDRTVPEAYRQAMLDGVKAYVPAFEAAGFRNGILAEILPDSANAADIRYATLRWSTSDVPAYGAIGPSLQDPRTGETLDADILFEANMIIGAKNGWRRMVDPANAMQAMLESSPSELNILANGGETASFGSQIGIQAGLARASLIATNAIEIGDPVPDEFIYELLKWVTMHEVGHTLGLRHNFRSSIDTPLEKLHDRDWAIENGVFSSVMEYPSLNISGNGEANGHYYNPGMGSYDRWAISYGYTPDPDKAEELARQSAAPGHAYGTDEDARGAGAIDPTVNVFDLGADPLAWGKERAELAKSLWPKVPDIALADDEAYLEATGAFRALLNTYAAALVTGVKYIGGQYQYRDHVGDPNGRMPFEPVPVEKQLEALEFIIEYAFAEDAFYVDPEVLQKLGANRWSHWGSSLTVNGRIDYPLHETVLNVQRMLLNRMTGPFVFARILDAEHKYGQEQVLGIPALMSGLSEAVWAEAWAAPGRNVPANRRNLQRAHVDRLTEIVTSAPDRTPADARAVGRLSLEDLADRLGRRLSPPAAFDDYTLAHYKESLARIEKALDAGLELEN